MFRILLFVLFFSPSLVFAVSDPVQVNLTVDGCNYNDVCEPHLGETYLSCPSDCDPPSEGGGGGGQTIIPLEIFNLIISVGINDVSISWSTTDSALAVFRWGTGVDYSGGSLTDVSYKLNHNVSLGDLEPNTEYHFKLDLKGFSGSELSYFGQFKTLPVIEVLAPNNVSQLRIHPSEVDLKLTWKNPLDPNFHSVRIMRSDKFFPQDPMSGLLVFEGVSESFLDTNVSSGIIYYYTVFVKDIFGNFSSGSVVMGKLLEVDEVVPSPPKFELPIEFIPDPKEMPPYLKDLSASDFMFVQNEKIIEFVGNTAEVSGNSSISISVSDEFFGRLSKSVMVHVRDLDDFVFNTYLFKRAKEEGKLIANIPALGQSGSYEIWISIVDFDNLSEKSFPFILIVSGEDSGLLDRLQFAWLLYILIWILAILIVISNLIWNIRAILKDSRSKTHN